MRYYKNFINGKWIEAKTDRTFESRNPAIWDEIIGIFPDSSKEDVDLAVESAKKIDLIKDGTAPVELEVIKWLIWMSSS